MRYCNYCHRITTGQPLFCNFCGRTYNLKLCPHRHLNPRNADTCSQCGSRELSTPEPRSSLVVRPLIAIASALLRKLPVLVLALLTVLFVFGLVNSLANNPQLLFQAILFALMLTFLWYLYMLLPAFLRRLISKLFRRSKRDDHGH